MDMSKLNKDPRQCIGGVSIFSGRPDPLWNVREDIAKKLEKIWKSLERWEGEHPSVPQLGYRGCFLRCKPGIEWLAYNGVVTRKIGRKYESRIDKNRSFERLLLDSAPKGILPEGIL
jgi:hypothetical protein